MAYEFGFLTTQDEFESALSNEDAFLVYFNSNSCNVGEALAPKLMKLIEEKFPLMKFYFVDIEMNPEIAAHHFVFVEPTILCFFGGKESLRKSRHFSIAEVQQSIERPYSLLFN